MHKPYAFHVLADDKYVFLAMSDAEYLYRIAFNFLADLYNLFYNLPPENRIDPV